MDGKALQKDGLNPRVNEEIRKILESASPAREYVKGQIIYRQGDTAEGFYYLAKGRASVFMTSPDGMEKTLSTALEGEILGEAAFFDKLPRVSSAKAVVNSKIVSVDRKKLISLIRSCPSLAMELLEIQAKRIRQLSAQIDSMSFLQADARIAQLLLQYKSVKKGRMTVCLTHEEIGSMVGASRVTVSKILNSFNKRGFIRTNYREIEIIDKTALEEILNGVNL